MGTDTPLDAQPPLADAGAARVKRPLISHRYAVYALALLLAANFFNYFDRTVTGSLANGLLALWVFAPFAIVISVMAGRRVRNERIEERVERAEAWRSPAA